MPKGELIFCPNCEALGRKEILGSIYKGTFRVLRFHKGETIIESNEFAVYCGKCGEKVYYYTNLKKLCKKQLQLQEQMGL